jgi:hypothetical protein
MPRVHDTSSIQEKHLPMNQTSPRVQHKDSRAHNPSKPPPTDPYTWNRHKGPHVSHWEKAQRETWWGQVSQSLGSVEPTLPRIAICFHVVLGDRSYNGFLGAQAVLASVAWPINSRGGGKNKDTHFNTTPSKYESFPSKEMLLLGIL